MYQNVEVPFQMWGNRQVLTEQQLLELPWVKEFSETFAHCFKRDEMRQILIYNPPEAA